MVLRLDIYDLTEKNPWEADIMPDLYPHNANPARGARASICACAQYLNP